MYAICIWLLILAMPLKFIEFFHGMLCCGFLSLLEICRDAHSTMGVSLTRHFHAIINIYIFSDTYI